MLFSQQADVSDVERWLRSGFVFVDGGSSSSKAGHSHEATSQLPCPWGLRQELGGPCGVLAAVQAFIVRELIWGVVEEPAEESLSQASTAAGQDSPVEFPYSQASSPSPVEERQAEEGSELFGTSLVMRLAERFRKADHQALLACALARILHLATPGSCYVWAEVSSQSSITKHEFSSAQALADWLVDTGALESSACPVLSFVCSVVLTRGVEEVLTDMDDKTAPLVGVFGHCSQELVNLCLIGRAVTNVFDGDVTFEDGSDVLTLQGIRQRPSIGFLSAMEPLRLCEVGRYLKWPLYPIWVLGTSTHYTLVFSGDCRINHHSPEGSEAPEAGVLGVSSCCAEACKNNHECLSASLLHFNGRDTGIEKPTLTVVGVSLPALSGAEEHTKSRPILLGDHDDKLFEEVLKCRWPRADISYPQVGDVSEQQCLPRIH
jgi:hypothetical protein